MPAHGGTHMEVIDPVRAHTREFQEDSSDFRYPPSTEIGFVNDRNDRSQPSRRKPHMVSVPGKEVSHKRIPETPGTPGQIR